jgi:hypothetical protein
MITTLLRRSAFLFAAETKRMNIKLYKPHFEKYFQMDATKVVFLPLRFSSRSKKSSKNTISPERE